MLNVKAFSRSRSETPDIVLANPEPNTTKKKTKFEAQPDVQIRLYIYYENNSKSGKFIQFQYQKNYFLRINHSKKGYKYTCEII